MTFHRQYLSASSLPDSPPPSPWRARARDYRPRRPMHLRQVALLIASLTLAFTFLFYYNHHKDDPLSLLVHHHPAPPDAAAHPSSHPVVSPAASSSASGRPYNLPSVDTHTHHDNSPVAAPAPPGVPPVVFSLIMFSADSASEGAVLLKSIIMYSSAPLEFHIICDKPAEEYLAKRLRLITHPSHTILVRFYRVTLADMIARIEREGAINTDHSAGAPGLMKLFIHEILPDTVKRSIFIDTDAFFITDPALLWDYFSHLGPTTAISMPLHPDQNAPHWHNANRICSCIMLLDLERLRALRLMDSSFYRNDTSGRFPDALAPPAFAAMYGAPERATGHYADVKLGDQGYWWAIISHRQDIFEHLSYEWEISSCLMDMYYTGLGDDAREGDAEMRTQVHTENTPHDHQAVLPKMLHFNCLDGTPRYYEWPGWSDPEDSLTRRWYPAVQYHVGFKWLWLNHHSSTSKMQLETIDRVVFADERFAQEHAN